MFGGPRSGLDQAPHHTASLSTKVEGEGSGVLLLFARMSLPSSVRPIFHPYRRRSAMGSCNMVESRHQRHLSAPRWLPYKFLPLPAYESAPWNA